MSIDELSLVSLKVKCYFDDQYLSCASGFVVKNIEDTPFLITNWHVVAGRHADTNKPLDKKNSGIPNNIRIRHHTDQLGQTEVRKETLLTSDGSRRWLEHSSGSKVDVVALPLENIENIKLYPLDLSLIDTDIIPRPGMPVFIIGFPFGKSAGECFPIWKTGHVASDPDLDIDSLPCFLVDATARSGMSGGPVILRLYGPYETSTGYSMTISYPTTKFLGIYSGRIHPKSDLCEDPTRGIRVDDGRILPQSELGRIWKPSVLSSILTKKFDTQT